MKIDRIRLTQYSHGAGCGCKIAPNVLEEILSGTGDGRVYDRLLVGNTARDDAAVYDLGNGSALISTTDFFMPIVDDPEMFGRIAAANALSDVYAMGGTPVMAIAILGWPIEKLPAAVARQVVEGGRAVCTLAGIPLAGGHSIDSPEPIFGLAASGLVEIDHLRRNDTAREGDLLMLSKPLGVGILTTAEKKALLPAEETAKVAELMTRLNTAGEHLARLQGVHAMTDVTGFGLAGHLLEMCGERLDAEIWPDAIPLVTELHPYLDLKCIPGGTHRNWASYGHHVGPMDEHLRNIVCDPQTSGGLLVAVAPEAVEEVEHVLREHGARHALTPIGRLRLHTSGSPHVFASN